MFAFFNSAQRNETVHLRRTMILLHIQTDLQ